MTQIVTIPDTARRILAATGAPFTEADGREVRLRRQWIVQRADEPKPFDHWIRRPLNASMTLVHHPETRITQVGTADEGVTIIGIAVLPDEPLRDVMDLFAQPGQRSHDAIVRSLRHVGGTYALIRHDSKGVWIYTDAGIMGVYHADGRAASTPRLLPDLQRDAAIDRAFPLGGAGGANEWYPGSLTPFLGVRALLANHCLCVESGRSQRFWPVADIAPAAPDAHIDRICTILRGMMIGAARRGDLLVGLTGGRDSRTVLAAAQPIAGDCELFTLRSEHTEAGDIEFPREMARRFGLRHRFVDVASSASRWLINWYDEMTGGMVVGAGRQAVDACRELSGLNRIHVNGALGELAMPYYWHSANPRSVRLRSLAKKQGSKPPMIMAAVREWFESVVKGGGHLNAATIYNLMHLEQLGGRWWSAVETAGSLFYESFTPFCHRELFEHLCALPPRMIYENGLRREFVRRLWPDLLSVPYCRPSRRLAAYVPRHLKETAKWIVDPVHRRSRRADAQLPQVTTLPIDRERLAA